jgi:hypothetical protein
MSKPGLDASSPDSYPVKGVDQPTVERRKVPYLRLSFLRTTAESWL